MTLQMLDHPGGEADVMLFWHRGVDGPTPGGATTSCGPSITLDFGQLELTAPLS